MSGARLNKDTEIKNNLSETTESRRGNKIYFYFYLQLYIYIYTHYSTVQQYRSGLFTNHITHALWQQFRNISSLHNYNKTTGPLLMQL